MAIRKRTRLVIGMAVGCAFLLSTPLWAVYLGRRISWFDVRRVEVAGARLVAPHDLVRMSGITGTESLFDDSEPWTTSLTRHPVVEEVSISRRLPATVKIRVREKQAVALVGDEVLGLATAAGEILPVDPTAAPADLPIVHGSLDDPEEAPAVRVLLAETARLAALDPTLMSQVSEISGTPEADVYLLRHARADILVRLGVDAARLAQLRAVLADLLRGASAHQESAEGRTSVPRPTLDLRYDEQVVVRHLSPRELS